MKKKYVLAVFFNIVALGFYLFYFGHSSPFYCGQTEDKPSLYMGLSPSWFSGRFQINRENQEIISSSEGDDAAPDKWVKGADLFRTIIAYDATYNEVGVFFRALNWDGREQEFLLRRFNPSMEEKYVYEVVAQEVSVDSSTWVRVDERSCREGVYKGLMYIFLLFIAVVNIVWVASLWVARTKGGNT